jgi:glycosyltransferase involved in cell wall biosynthesis
MRILLSAFSCGPRRGSEEGVGWNWAVETARLGHEVIALTQTCYRDEIEAEVASGRLPATLRFEYFMPAWLDRFQNKGVALKLEQPTHHLTHLIWQILAYRYVRPRLAAWRVDLVHHITYSGIRHPTLMGRLPVPLVLGPVGGGERAPLALRRGFGWRGWLIDLARDLHTYLIRFDPITRRACADALVVYVKTEESRRALPARFHDKIAVHLEIGTREAALPPEDARRDEEPLRFLYAGRFLYWKGMHLGLRAFAVLLRRGVAARLTMLGAGPDEQAWRQLAEELGITQSVDWLAWVEHNRMGELYRRHHALLFPSLHDSSGNVVLESLVHRLPVVCLDLGGPAEMVDATCGRVVATAGLSEAACAERLADALEALARDHELHGRLRDGAGERARTLRWPALVGSLYDDVRRRLQRHAGGAANLAADRIPAGPV